MFDARQLGICFQIKRQFIRKSGMDSGGHSPRRWKIVHRKQDSKVFAQRFGVFGVTLNPCFVNVGAEGGREPAFGTNSHCPLDGLPRSLLGILLVHISGLRPQIRG